jgi:hypothetical protein
MIPPSDVVAPTNKWSLGQVVYDAGPGECAVGVWDELPRLAIRWNGTPDHPLGTPQAYGKPTWFILPPDFGLSIASCILLQSHLDADEIQPNAAAAIVEWVGALARRNEV